MLLHSHYCVCAISFTTSSLLLKCAEHCDGLEGSAIEVLNLWYVKPCSGYAACHPSTRSICLFLSKWIVEGNKKVYYC